MKNTTKIHWLIAATSFVFVSHAHADLSRAQSQSIEKVTYRVAQIQYINPNQKYGPRDQVRHIEILSGCLKAVANAKQQGVSTSHMVTAYSEFPNARKTTKAPREWLATINQVEAHCHKMHRQVSMSVAQAPLEEAERQLAAFRKLKEFQESDMHAVIAPLDKCRAGVARATEAGVPADTVFHLNGRTKVTLANARQQICEPLLASMQTIQTALKGQKKAKLAKRLAPYRKVLKGDKRRIFEHGFTMLDLTVWGKKRVRLKTPKQFARATLWFQVLNHRDKLGRAMWKLRRHAFRGNRLKATTEKVGRGYTPPTSAFR